jgi:hypothetical protein
MATSTHDWRRTKFRRGLSTLYLPDYDALCGLLGPEWQPYVGMRDFIEQQACFNNKTSKAKPGESPHQYGCASDWTLWDAYGKPIWLPWKDERWLPYQQAIEKVGLRWGNDWNRNGDPADESFHDAYHNELSIACSWKHVHLVYKARGMTAAQQHIEANLISAMAVT